MKEIKKSEVVLLLILIIIVPLSFIVIRNLVYGDTNFFFISSSTLAFIFLLIWLLQILFKKPYLPLVFNCHQKEERSLTQTFNLFKLCSRCSAIYIGILLTPLLTFIPIHYHYYLLFSIPLIVDGVLQQYTTYESNHLKRIITGLLFAPALIAAVTLHHEIIYKIALKIYHLF